MHHGDMNFSSLMLYEKSIKESKLSTILRNLKRGWSDEQNKIRFKKRTPNRDGFIDPKVKVEGGSTTQGVKSTCARCGKKHFGKCVAGTEGCFTCGKDGHKVRYCPTIASRVREAKQVPPSAAEGDAPKSNHFYVLQAKGANSGDDASMLYIYLLCGDGFIIIWGVL